MRMKIEVRDESVVITGYVNAVERYSKPIRETLHGRITTFIERIKAGTFNKALKRNDDVKVLLNHDYDKCLGTTKDGSLVLTEDNIGLRAETTITDAEVVQKAKNDQLVGWSFGFYVNNDELGEEDDWVTRTVTDMDLIEVSILDSNHSPAYKGTSIEAREEHRNAEYRSYLEGGEEMAEDKRDLKEDLKQINDDAVEKHDEVDEAIDPDANEKVIDDAMEKHQDIEMDATAERLNLFATKVAEKVAELLKGDKPSEGESKPSEEKMAAANSKPEEKEKREIDYSDFESRLAKLKR